MMYCSDCNSTVSETTAGTCPLCGWPNQYSAPTPVMPLTEEQKRDIKLSGILARLEKIERDLQIFIRTKDMEEAEENTNCSCGEPGKTRVDNDLSAGVHCDECWNKLIDDARERSW